MFNLYDLIVPTELISFSINALMLKNIHYVK